MHCSLAVGSVAALRSDYLFDQGGSETSRRTKAYTLTPETGENRFTLRRYESYIGQIQDDWLVVVAAFSLSHALIQFIHPRTRQTTFQHKPCVRRFVPNGDFQHGNQLSGASPECAGHPCVPLLSYISLRPSQRMTVLTTAISTTLSPTARVVPHCPGDAHMSAPLRKHKEP